jgi:hypothetical protein
MSLMASLCLSQPVAFRLVAAGRATSAQKLPQGERRIWREVSRCQQFDLANDDYSATIAITTHTTRAFAFRADDLTDIGRDDEARRDYESASRIAPDDLRPRFGRIRFRFYQGTIQSPFKMQTFGSNSCTSTAVRTENSNPMYLRGGICRRY